MANAIIDGLEEARAILAAVLTLALVVNLIFAFTAFAILRRRRDVIGITRHAISQNFGVNLRATSHSVFVFLKNHNASAFAHETEFPEGVAIDRLPSRDYVFEFTLISADRGIQAKDITLIK